MKNTLLVTAVCAVLAAATTVQAKSFEIGGGATYWYSIDEAKDKSFDRDGLAYYVSSEIFLANYLAIALEVEKMPEDFVFLEEDMYLPAAYLILGDGIYVGAGVGGYYYDGEFEGDPWFALRGGFKIPFFSNALVLDVNVNYRTEKWDDIKNADDKIGSETLMVGAALRLAF